MPEEPTAAPYPPPSSTLRIAYVSQNMDVARAAYMAEHVYLNHETVHIRSAAEIRRMHLKPDVIVINPLVMTTHGIEGPCAAQEILSPSTLIVVLYPSLGSSHTVYTRHALNGKCHPRMLLHYPSPFLRSGDVVKKIDQMARGKGGGPLIDTTGHIPRELTHGPLAFDLGELILTNAYKHRNGDSLTYGRLLYAAAVDTTWGAWKDLAARLGFAEGHVKNVKARLGRDIRSLVEARTSTEIGVPRDQNKAWRIVEFTRFVTEHRSFIRTFCEHHLHLDHHDFPTQP